MTLEQLRTKIAECHVTRDRALRIKGYNNYLQCDFCDKTLAAMFDNDLEGSAFACMDCWELIKQL